MLRLLSGTFFLLFLAVLLFCTFSASCGAPGRVAAPPERAPAPSLPSVPRLPAEGTASPGWGVRVPPEPQPGGDTSLARVSPARCSCEAKRPALVTGEGCAGDIRERRGAVGNFPHPREGEAKGTDATSGIRSSLRVSPCSLWVNSADVSATKPPDPFGGRGSSQM